jgi:hypothetical protein
VNAASEWTCQDGWPLPVWRANELLTTRGEGKPKDIPRPPQLHWFYYQPCAIDPRLATATAAAARHVGGTSGFNPPLQGLLLLLAAAVGGGVWQATVEGATSGIGYVGGGILFALLAVGYLWLSNREKRRFAPLLMYADLWQAAAQESFEARARGDLSRVYPSPVDRPVSVVPLHRPWYVHLVQWRPLANRGASQRRPQN